VYFPSELNGRLRYVTYDQTQSLRNPAQGYAPFGYDLISDSELPPPTELRKASSEIPHDIRLIYLQLPNRTDPRISELARRVTEEATNNYDRAFAIQTYLRNTFGYSLDP